MVFKLIFIAILSFVRGLDKQKVKYVSFNKDPCLPKPIMFIEPNQDKLLHHPFRLI